MKSTKHGLFILLSVFGASLAAMPPEAAAIAHRAANTSSPQQSQGLTQAQHASQFENNQFERGQFERIYISSEGDFLGAHTSIGNTVLYIDSDGQMNLVARDYTAELDYDYRGQLSHIGTAAITYDFRGRLQQIGTTRFAYDFRGRLSQVGDNTITYTNRNRVSQIGDVDIRYERGSIDTISDNYTRTGARVIVLTPPHY